MQAVTVMKTRKKKGRAATPRKSFELLWGQAPRRRRGPMPAIGRDSIVGSALAIADREGLGAVTMERVARAMNVTPMALYRHVPGKRELVDLMTDMAFSGAPATDSSNWRRAITDWAHADLAMFERHPWLHESVMHGTAVGPNWLEWIDAALRALSNVALAPQEKMSVILLIDGHARASAQVTSGAKMRREWADNFGRALEKSASDPRFGALSALVNAGSFAPPMAGQQSAFEFGLERLIDGVAQHARARTR
jgi:AcrR family transcriptional regulator